MLFTSLKQVKLPTFKTDGVELRFDCIADIDTALVRHLCAQQRTIFTVRKQSHGGQFKGTEKERLQQIEQLLRANPTFIDIECDTDPCFIQCVYEQFTHTKILLSYHNLTHTPQDLSAILSQMISPYAYAYKIAAFARSTLDALRLLLFVRMHREVRLSGICMGEEGKITRILGPVFGNFIDYAPENITLATAPGQLTIAELHSVYHYFSLNPSTALYGVIGDPIDRSIGHHVHNAIMRNCNLKAVYVKMRVKQEELAAFLPLAQACGFAGLSVTMPLKQKLFSLLNHVDQKTKHIGAINTLIFKKNAPIGYNTDAKGALDALETKQSVRGKIVVLIGAGGAARAIAYEAHKRGAKLRIVNRTKKHAWILAQSLSANYTGGNLENVPHIYDIIINTTPHPCPIDPLYLIPGAIAMDINTCPKMTPFLCQAQENACTLVFGYEMYLHQALEQVRLWFHIHVDRTCIEAECLKWLA